ncbi:MAG: WecB/TagA/CpsF family glycosyltransferase [Rhodobacteraceae bacterium]|nr:WecB/TagA/CpsF family glycosyltransferase [Paracoccaceae bacterium]
MHVRTFRLRFCGNRRSVVEFRTKSGVVRVNVATLDDLLKQVAARLRGGEGFALATLNLDHLVKMAASAEFCWAYQAQDMIVADGNPIVWLSRLANRPIELIPGSELVVPLARLAAEEGVGVALVGSTRDALDLSAKGLKKMVPSLSVVAQIAPPFGFDPTREEADQILQELASSGAQLCFLALGAPKQEVFAARGREAAPTVGFACVGAGLDFIAGSQVRAPKWVRKLALEWLWRMLSSPIRLGPRYLRCIGILPGLFFEALRMRRWR